MLCRLQSSIAYLCSSETDRLCPFDDVMVRAIFHAAPGPEETSIASSRPVIVIGASEEKISAMVTSSRKAFCTNCSKASPSGVLIGAEPRHIIPVCPGVLALNGPTLTDRPLKALSVLTLSPDIEYRDAAYVVQPANGTMTAATTSSSFTGEPPPQFGAGARGGQSLTKPGIVTGNAATGD